MTPEEKAKHIEDFTKMKQKLGEELDKINTAIDSLKKERVEKGRGYQTVCELLIAVQEAETTY